MMITYNHERTDAMKDLGYMYTNGAYATTPMLPDEQACITEFYAKVNLAVTTYMEYTVGYRQPTVSTILHADYYIKTLPGVVIRFTDDESGYSISMSDEVLKESSCRVIRVDDNWFIVGPVMVLDDERTLVEVNLQNGRVMIMRIHDHSDGYIINKSMPSMAQWSEIIHKVNILVENTEWEM